MIPPPHMNPAVHRRNVAERDLRFAEAHARTRVSDLDRAYWTGRAEQARETYGRMLDVTELRPSAPAGRREAT